MASLLQVKDHRGHIHHDMSGSYHASDSDQACSHSAYLDQGAKAEAFRGSHLPVHHHMRSQQGALLHHGAATPAALLIVPLSAIALPVVAEKGETAQAIQKMDQSQ